MEGVGARLGRSSARYGPATTFTGLVRKWRNDWVPVAPAAASASSTGTGSGGGSRGSNLVLFMWTPQNGANGGGDGEQAAAAAEETATRRRRYVPIYIKFMFGSFCVANEMDGSKLSHISSSTYPRSTSILHQNGIFEGGEPLMQESMKHKYLDSGPSNGGFKRSSGEQTAVENGGPSHLSTPSSRSLSPTRHSKGEYDSRFNLAGQGLLPVSGMNSNISWKQVPYMLNQPLRYSTTIFQRFRFSSSSPQQNDKEVNQPKDQGSTAHGSTGEASNEDSSSSGSEKAPEAGTNTFRKSFHHLRKMQDQQLI